MNDRTGQRAGLLAALSAIELTGEEGQHDHNYETGCRDYTTTYARPVDAVTDELLTELERRGWKLVQVNPFVAADPPPGCCGGWTGPNGQVTMCCPLATGSTSAPAIGGADVEPPDVLTDRQGMLDAFAERLTKIEDWIDRQDEGWQYR